IIPTLNEAVNLEQLLLRCTESLRRFTDSFEIIVVDDNSEDGTHALAQKLAAEHPEFHLQAILRTKPRDLAGSVVDGWAAAKGDVLAVIDGDLQHPPEALTNLLDAMESTKADVAVASRHVKGGGVSEWSLARRFVSWTACLIAGFMLPGIL